MSQELKYDCKIELPKIEYELHLCDGIIFTVYGKEYNIPNDWHRFWARVLLGWIYKRGEE